MYLHMYTRIQNTYAKLYAILLSRFNFFTVLLYLYLFSFCLFFSLIEAHFYM